MGKYRYYMPFSSHPKPEELDNSGAVRFDGQYWWLLNHRRKGWASFGFPYPNMKVLLERWEVRLGELQVDEHGAHFPFELAKSNNPELRTL